ncbi:hypothetical protein SAMD00023353_2001180 [Rosellinia necatrix]|uniref:Uncharacterized protein n=1 Tax=Rosellinia necatrix TaxID=77044 RepID=A0A1S8A7M9_ROSNE|nr:hypothetical protein SAMD00023353_2001180 [Rosellinia necatrix]
MGCHLREAWYGWIPAVLYIIHQRLINGLNQEEFESISNTPDWLSRIVVVGTSSH